jgi:hypothetical protein
MADSDSEHEREQAPEILPEYKIRYSDMDFKHLKEVIKCKIGNSCLIFYMYVNNISFII